MSKSRAKRKQRQRARAVSGGATAAAARSDAPDTRVRTENGATSAATRDKASGSHITAGAAGPDARDGVTRPQPIWAPFPLTEIGMAAGIIMFGLSFESDGAQATRLTTIGVCVLAVVVGELCLREHLSGYRSHTLLLAAISVAIAHAVVYFVVTDAYAGPLALAADAALAGALAWLLRARFSVARDRARTQTKM